MDSKYKKVLFVLPNQPWPLDRGGNQAMFNGIECLRGLCEIFVIFPVYAGEDSDSMDELKAQWPDVKIIPYLIKADKEAHGLRKLCGRALRKLSRWALHEQYLPTTYSQRMLKHFDLDERGLFDLVERTVQENGIELVQIEMIWKSTLGLALDKKIKKILVHHELRYVCHEIEMRDHAEDAQERAAFQLAKILEVGILNQYDAIVTLSKTDRQKLIDAGVTALVYDSIAVVSPKTASSDCQTDPHTLVFMGPENHNPNKMAVMWFLENCWWKLKSVDNDYKFQVIGKWSQATIDTLRAKYPDIAFLGFVDDIVPYFSSGITIVPLTIGSGIRMKILEAVNIGSPVVTTSVGVEGLPLEDGKECLIADTPQGFVDAILRLKDPLLAKHLRDNACTLIKEKYSLEALRKNRMSIYSTL